MAEKEPAKQDQRRTDANHETTWGATEAAKTSWENRNGDPARRATERANKEAEA